jgi:hypothetical protein
MGMNRTKSGWNLLGVLLILLTAGCSSWQPEKNQIPDSASTMVDSGSWYSRVQWPHDGNPYESQHFIIYSDGDTLEAREELAAIAEDLLSELITEFEIVPEEMFRLPPGQDKIHIYSYISYFPKQWGMRAYYGGVVVWSLDHKERDTNLGIYQPVLKHELVHVIESLLKGRDVANISPAIRTQAWFSEGLAEAVAGGTSGTPVNGPEYLEVLTAQYGNLNPIAYKTDGLLVEALESHPMIGFEYYYPMSQLAVEYLLDPDGLDKSLFDVRDIFLAMAGGVDFSTAFEQNLGISVQAYEADFFDLMDGYLTTGPASLFLRLLDLWAILSLLSMLLVAWLVIRKKKLIQQRRWAWVFLATLFGPVGLIVYLVSDKNQGLETSLGWRGLVAAMFSAAAKGAGLLLVIFGFHFIAPEADSGPLIILAPLLFSWLVLSGPLESRRSGVSYGTALFRVALQELGSTVLVLAGMLPVLIVLPEKIWFLSVAPPHPHFWGLVSLSAITGTVAAYLFYVWLEHRCFHKTMETAPKTV